MPDAHLQRTERFDLRALYETSRLLSTSLDLSFVLDNLLLTAMSKLFVTRGVGMLFDPVDQQYEVAASKGIAALPVKAKVDLGGSVGEEILRDEGVPALLAENKVAMVLPISAGDRHIGLIGLGTKATKQPFTPAELEFVKSLVNMSATAVQNSLMVTELKKANRDLDHKIQQLNTLFDLSQEFNASIDRKQLVKLLSFALMGQLLVNKYLFLMRRTGETADGEKIAFETVAVRGIREKQLDEVTIGALECAEETILLQEEQVDDEWQTLQNLGFRLVLPIQHQGSTCAVLCLGPKMTKQAYGTDDMDFLYALGNLAFVSLQNSYLVEAQIEKERLEEEMRLARDIQVGLLPRELPPVAGVEVASLALPSREVGGDYFDVIPLADDRVLMAIADVTGKGVPASLLMANLQACLHVMVPMDLAIEAAIDHINRVICQNTSYDKFITFFSGIFNTKNRQFQYVNAGHNPPMLLRADGTIELLEVGGLLLGVMKGMPYLSEHVTLNPGDVLAMFTDGVTEAMSPEEEEYEEHRLEAVLRAHQAESATDILEAVREDIRRFTDDAPILSDDLTMIVVKVAEPPAA